MRCLITGATGFVGGWLLKRLKEDGHRLAVLVRPTSDLWRIEPWLDEVTILQGDLSNIVSAAGKIKEFAPEWIFHLAWSGGHSSAYHFDPNQVYANVPGSLELMRIAAASGAAVFVNLGSCVEYGVYRVPVRETDAVQPANLYGAAKHAVELLGEKLCPRLGLRFASFRLFWAYGPGDDDARLLPSLYRKLLRGERHAMTPGEQLWDLSYIEDVIDALVKVAETPDAAGFFNLGSGEPVSIRSVAQMVGAALGREELFGIGDLPYAAGQIMHLQADVSRLRAATGWEPKVSLAEGLRRTKDWYLSGSRTPPLATGRLPSPASAAPSHRSYF
jgi:nucleoside-diphosphate-sugar epimerase